MSQIPKVLIFQAMAEELVWTGIMSRVYSFFTHSIRQPGQSNLVFVMPCDEMFAYPECISGLYLCFHSNLD